MYRNVESCEETQRTLRHIIRYVLSGLLISGSLIFYSCADIHTRIGRQPDIDVLDKRLHIGLM
jgi:hypothetical protein